MKNFEGINPSQEPKQESKQERRAHLISRYIDIKIINVNESLLDKQEKEIEKYYLQIDPKEKADILYGKVMAYITDKQTEKEMQKRMESKGERFVPEAVDPYLISEIKVLSADEDVKKLFSKTYGEARVDAKKFRFSELGKSWQGINKEIAEKEKIYKQLAQEIYLNKISRKGSISSAKSHMARLVENMTALGKRKNNLETLQGFSKTAENTDIVAGFQYEKQKEYKRQLNKGFVWLPSREEIHQEIISAILNHRRPLLIGEAGSGKSEQADAAAIELTGYEPTKIECESTTGEKQLIKDKEIASQSEGGETYEEFGELMQAFTGYNDSKQEEPTVKTGRIVRLDEVLRLGDRSYSILKRAHQDQKKPGTNFYGRPVLAGAGVIGTTNPAGPRYPGRYNPDPADRREWSNIDVNYPEMSNEEPELYEFALIALFDENNHIAAVKEEIGPAYEKKEISEDKKEILADGSIVVAKDEIIKDMTDTRHGSLWRFCGAIKSLQESFVYGNAEIEKYPDIILRFKEDSNGSIEITTDGSGEPLTLSSSTITLGEMASWMSGFNERKQKQNEEFRVDTLTEWLDFKMNTYLKQADKADKKKLEAIFRHFHFLEDRAPDISEAKPLTPKEIGYLSPRVPRPVYTENPQVEEDTIGKELPPITEAKEYRTRQVLIEDGTKILMKESELNIGEGEKATKVYIGDKFIQNNESFVFAGVVEDKSSKDDGKPIGQFASGEKLYKVFSPEELDLGILNEFDNSTQKTETGNFGIDDFEQSFIRNWEEGGCKESLGEFVF